MSPIKVINKKPKEYLQQKLRYCGGYVIKGILSAYNLDDGRHPKKYLPIIQRLNLKSFGMTTPIVISKSLEKYGLSALIKRANKFSDSKKIKLIKNELNKDHPVILLIGNGYSHNGKHYPIGRYLFAHWITIWGYNDNEEVFYIYDSFYHKKDRMPVGNVKKTYPQVLRDWKGTFYTSDFLYIPVIKK